MEQALSAIWNSTFLGAIILTIALILVGYLFTKHNVFKTNPSQIFSTIAMKIALPSLAFCGFMSDFDVSQFGIFLISFIGFGVLFLLARIIFIKINKDDRDLCRICFSLGQVSLIGLPIAKAIYGHNAVTSANMVLLSFRLYLYIYAFFLISKVELNKDSIKQTLKRTFLTPMMIAMFVGLLFWLSQLFMPKVSINGVDASLLRIDLTLPQLYYPIKVIGDLAVPISMLLVGSSLAKINLKLALKNVLAWVTAALRSFLAPSIILGLVVLYQVITKGTDFEFSHDAAITIVILFSAPVSVTVNTLVVEYDRNSILTSDTVFLSTLLSLISMPVYIVLSELVF